MTDMNEFLNRSADSFKEPPLYPVGSYLFTVMKREFGTSDRKKTPFVEFHLSPKKPYDDVDQVALAQIDNFGQKALSTTFYLTEGATYRLGNFLRCAGVDTSQPLQAAIDDAIGKDVVGIVSHEVTVDRGKTRTFVRIEEFAAVPS